MSNELHGKQQEEEFEPGLVRQLLETQSQELIVQSKQIEHQRQIREKELEVEREANRQHIDYARKALDIQSADYANMRQFMLQQQSRRLILSVGGGIATISIVWMFLAYGEAATLSELVKLVVSAALGGGAGYAMGRRRDRDDDLPEDLEDE